MSRIVKCDVCGRIYSQSYLSAHKRLAHKEAAQSVSAAGEHETIQAVLRLYGQLSGQGQETVRKRLLATAQEKETSSNTGRKRPPAKGGMRRLQ
jgi:hypothetical protein